MRTSYMAGWRGREQAVEALAEPVLWGSGCRGRQAVGVPQLNGRGGTTTAATTCPNDREPANGLDRSMATPPHGIDGDRPCAMKIDRGRPFNPLPRSLLAGSARSIVRSTLLRVGDRRHDVRAPCEEMIDRLLRRVTAQRPSRSLDLDRAREGRAKVRTNDLARHAEHIGQFLRPIRLAIERDLRFACHNLSMTDRARKSIVRSIAFRNRSQRVDQLSEQTTPIVVTADNTPPATPPKEDLTKLSRRVRAKRADCESVSPCRTT